MAGAPKRAVARAGVQAAGKMTGAQRTGLRKLGARMASKKAKPMANGGWGSSTKTKMMPMVKKGGSSLDNAKTPKMKKK